MHYTDYDTRLAAYGLVVDDQDRVLLALWNEAEKPLWTMPGGGVEMEETVEKGLVRELREETGYDVEVGRLLGIDTYVIDGAQRRKQPGRPLKAVRVVYEVVIVGGELTHEQDGTTDEARWIPLSEVAALDRVSIVDIAIGLR